MKKMSPESLMMSYGFKPELSEGAIKPPIFQTSTFVFRSAEHGKAFFEQAYGLREKDEDEELGLIYSRLNNPDLEILENRLTLWDQSEDAAVFESGMGAITTTLLSFLEPGDLLLHSNPIYGGTDHFVKHVLPKFGINILGFDPLDSQEDIEKLINEKVLKMPNYIKIDVDGIELQILKGAKNVLESGEIRSISIEINEARSQQFEEIKNLLEKNKYAIDSKGRSPQAYDNNIKFSEQYNYIFKKIIN